MSDFWKFVILIFSSYLLGNITFARLFAFTRNKDDITTHGSGNPGTMNMLRTHGLSMAVITLIFDALKSVISCIWAYFWLLPSGAYIANLAMYVAGFACVIGHCFPILYKFKGGKGVATSFGVACVVRPILIPITLVTFLVVFLVRRIGSLASLSAVAVFFIGESIYLLVYGYYASYAILVLLITLIVFAHRSNIKKLVDNKESEINLEDAVQKDIDYANEQKEKREKALKMKQDKNKSNK